MVLPRQPCLHLLVLHGPGSKYVASSDGNSSLLKVSGRLDLVTERLGLAGTG